MNNFVPKHVGHIQSICRVRHPDKNDFGDGSISRPQYAYRDCYGQHLYLEEDVQMLWDQLQAARETIKLQSTAIESILTARKLLESKK